MPFTSDIPTIIRAAKAGGFVRTNESFAEKVNIPVEELGLKDFSEWIITEDQPLLTDLFAGKRESCVVRHQTKSGDSIELNVRVSEKQEDDFVLLAKLSEPDTEQKYNDNFPGEANVKSTLHEIAHIVEEQNPGYRCSILLVEDGKFVKGAGPSLPEDYNNAIDGFAIGPTVGSCGTAIYWNTPVIVCDIQNDPLWVPFAELAKGAGVYACWSHPFTSKSGRVLGALAFYSPEPRKPTAEQLQQLKAAAAMTGLAVERGRAEEALREKHRQTLELEEQLTQAAKMEALGVLAGGVAHDFNNVLNTILANAEYSLMMLEEFPESEDRIEIKERLDDVVLASQRAGNFCKQMLSYAGQAKVKTKKTEVKALVSELNSLVAAALSKKTVLDFALDENQIFVEGDENQLLQVIMNLITNAGEALKGQDTDGKILVSSSVEEFTAEKLKKLSPDADDLPHGSYVCISVKDNGPGITDKVKARIFDPFFTTKATGRGLGLSAVKGIVKKHGGIIYLESEIGKGTTFSVLLPAVQQASSSKEANSTENSDIQPIAHKRILLADDEASLLKIFTKILKHKGFDVVSAKNGQEALEQFNQSPESFDCVLLDMNMPKLSGQEVAMKISQAGHYVPMLLMSGYDEGEVNNEFDESILAGTLQKPVSNKALLEMLDSILHNKQEKKKAA